MRVIHRLFKLALEGSEGLGGGVLSSRGGAAGSWHGLPVLQGDLSAQVLTRVIPLGRAGLCVLTPPGSPDDRISAPPLPGLWYGALSLEIHP